MKSRVILWLFVALAILAASFLWSCGGSDDDEDDDGDDFNPGDDDDSSSGDWDDWRDALPDEESLTLLIPETNQKALGELAIWYDATVDFTRDVNGHVLLFFSHIDEITSYPPASDDGTTMIWGPWTDPYSPPTSAQMRFVMTEVATDTYDYMLQWRDRDSTDDNDWTNVWIGHTVASTDTARRGTGDFTVDYTAAKALDPTINEEGEITVIYDTVGPGKQIDIQYFDFYSEDWEDGSGPPEPIDATYNYLNDGNQDGTFLFDWYDDIHQNSTTPEYDEIEHIWFNTRWQGSGSGRTDVIITDGDLPQIGTDIWGSPVDQWNGSECWGDDFMRIYYEESADLQNGSSMPGDQEGQESDCAFSRQMPQI